MASLQQEVFD